MNLTYPDQFLIIEALHIDRIGVGVVAEFSKVAEKQRRDINAFVPVPFGALDLWVDANGSTDAALHAGYERKLFRKSVYAKFFVAGSESPRVDWQSVLVGSFMYKQQSDFIQREIPNVVSAIITLTLGELLFDVADAVQMNVMQHDELIIPRRHYVLLEVISAHSVSESFGRKRVFGQVTRRPAVRYYNRSNQSARPHRSLENRELPIFVCPRLALDGATHPPYRNHSI